MKNVMEMHVSQPWTKNLRVGFCHLAGIYSALDLFIETSQMELWWFQSIE